jgi:hypothetical protein
MVVELTERFSIDPSKIISVKVVLEHPGMLRLPSKWVVTVYTEEHAIRAASFPEDAEEEALAFKKEVEDHANDRHTGGWGPAAGG